MTLRRDRMSLDTSRIPELPAAGYYIADFLTPDEEEQILTSIHKLPATRWTALTRRRLLSLPTQLTGQAKDTLIASPLPAFLDEPVLPRLKSLNIFSSSPHNAPNHVLVNEYQPGEGIMPHTDGPAYYPITATISLGGHTVLEIYKRNEAGDRDAVPSWRILQEPRSLLITTEDMYRDTLHGISEIHVDEDIGPDTISNWSLLGESSVYATRSANRQTRVSLTYRDVLKVSKLGGALKFMNKK